MTSNNSAPNYVNLDLVRGLAAVVVLLSHARSYLIMPPVLVEDASLPAKLFYFATGFGHEAVMVFFVLSGFFISRSIVNLTATGRFTWRRYLVSRLSRLWVVLIPALLLTAGWDHLGIALGGGDFYAGRIHEYYNSIPGGGSGGVDLSAANFLHNALFLVEVTTPAVYGTNGPLWSLTYEFWYYILFPLGLLLVLGGSSALTRLLYATLLLALVWYLPGGLLKLGVVWLFGYAVLMLWRRPAVQRLAARRWYAVVSLAGFALSMGISRVGLIADQLHADLLIGLCFALFMPAMIAHAPTAHWFERLSTGLSTISYSLYLTHFPLLAFVATIGLDNRQLPVDATGLTVFIGMLSVCMLYAMLVYWLFERNTAQVADRLHRVLQNPHSQASPAAQTR